MTVKNPWIKSLSVNITIWFFFFVILFLLCFRVSFFLFMLFSSKTKSNFPTHIVIHCQIFGFLAQWHKSISYAPPDDGVASFMVSELVIMVEMQVGVAQMVVKHVDLHSYCDTMEALQRVHGASSTRDLRQVLTWELPVSVIVSIYIVVGGWRCCELWPWEEIQWGVAGCVMVLFLEMKMKILGVVTMRN